MLSTKSFQLGFKLSHRILIEIRTAFSVPGKPFFVLSKYKLFGMFVSVFRIVSVVAFAEEIIYIGSWNLNIYMTLSGWLVMMPLYTLRNEFQFELTAKTTFLLNKLIFWNWWKKVKHSTCGDITNESVGLSDLDIYWQNCSNATISHPNCTSSCPWCPWDVQFKMFVFLFQCTDYTLIFE